jgi:lipoprotein-releasing system permease protein
MSLFEWLVALRYLRAKRKRSVISVITVISILGVAAGVAALIIALAVNNGFQSTLQNTLLGATAHVSILEANPEFGIDHWETLIPKLQHVPHVASATPGLYGQVSVSGPLTGSGAVLKGVPLDGAYPIPDLLHHLKAGNLESFRSKSGEYGIVLGVRLAEAAGVKLGSPVSVISYQGRMTPLGPIPSRFRFRVVGIFESGLYELDSTWAFTNLRAAQQVLDLSDVVNTIELRLDNIFEANAVARTAEQSINHDLVARTWMDQNRSLLNALKLEKRVSVITVGLIELVAALNILVVLVMLVMEKQRDIAILMSFGTRRAQIQRIFVLQGLMICAVGCLVGLAIGHSATWLLDRNQWLRLDEQVYALSYVPFQTKWSDSLWVTALAFCTSLLATIHPSWSASRIAPAEALRYE